MSFLIFNILIFFNFVILSRIFLLENAARISYIPKNRNIPKVIFYTNTLLKKILLKLENYCKPDKYLNWNRNFWKQTDYTFEGNQGELALLGITDSYSLVLSSTWCSLGKHIRL